ncbi:GNAT family N-acetyltransferase [Lacinutrix undariae]
MKKNNININNLTTLWKTAASYAPNNLSDKNFECAYIPNTQWPNRIWAKQPLSLEELEKTKQKLGPHYKNITFSHFYTPNINESLQKNQNLKAKSIQYGMSVSLHNKFKTQKNIVFKTVSNEDEAQLWSEAFYSAFGYEISTKTILNTKEHIPFYLIYLKQELIGTIILFITNKTAGIHSLGVIPQKRKQGFATEIMHHILNTAINKNLSFATLQASQMAKDMYLKMGFSIDFLMENYQLK